MTARGKYENRCQQEAGYNSGRTENSFHGFVFSLDTDSDTYFLEMEQSPYKGNVKFDSLH